PHAAGEQAVVGEEIGEYGKVGAAEDLDLRAAARPGAGNDVGLAVAVHVPGGDEHAAGEFGVVGEKAAEQGQVDAAEDLDVRAAAGARAGNDVIGAVAIDVAGGHADAAAEVGRVG